MLQEYHGTPDDPAATSLFQQRVLRCESDITTDWRSLASLAQLLSSLGCVRACIVWMFVRVCYWLSGVDGGVQR